MSLAQLQRVLQGQILQRSSGIHELVRSADADARLAIYCNAYASRLIEALAANYPVLQALLGESFEVHAREYVSTHLSRTESIRWYGAELADVLAAAGQPALADLARLEWAIAQAFDAADAPTLTTEDLQSIGPAEWAGLRFTLHPSVSYLQLQSNAGAIAQAHFKDQPLSEPAPGACSHWLIWRHDLIPQLRELEDGEARSLAVLIDAGSFGEMCAALCELLEAERVPLTAASYLKTWVSAGLFGGCS
jgi:hypothetical protein